MFKICGLDHIVLRTTRLKEMLHFYCTILGCNIERIQAEFGLTQLRAGDNIIDLLEAKEPINKANRNLEHFCLRVMPFDYEAMKTYFNDHGIEILRYGERYGAQGYHWSFYVTDPEGNEIELVQKITPVT